MITDRFYQLLISQDHGLGHACLDYGNGCVGGRNPNNPTPLDFAFCGGETLYLDNLAQGSTVSWTASPASEAFFSPSPGNPTALDLNPAYNGPLQINATVFDPAGNVVGTRVFSGWAGAPARPTLNQLGTFCASIEPIEQPGIGGYFVGLDNGGAMPGFHFTLYNNQTGQPIDQQSNSNDVQSSTYIPQTYFTSPGWYSAVVMVKNNCGASYSDLVDFEVQYCSPSFGRAFPNPTQEWLTFKLDDEISIREIGYTLSYTTTWAVCA